jgi:hypothetical protein
MSGKHEPNGTDWIHGVLEPDQLAASKRRYGRRPLRGGILLLLWILRLYVVLMILLVAYQVCKSLSAPH